MGTLTATAITLIISLLIPNIAFAFGCQNTKVREAYAIAGGNEQDARSLCEIVSKKPRLYSGFSTQNFALTLEATKEFRAIGDLGGKATILSILILSAGFDRDEVDIHHILTLQKKTDGCMTIEKLAGDMEQSLRINGNEFQTMARNWDHDFFVKYALMDMYQSHGQCHVHE